VKRINRQLARILAAFFLCLIAGLIDLSSSSPAAAQDYPTKPISMIVPYPPGGRTDLAARTLAEFLKAELKVPIVVLNKPGASGVLGAKELSAARPNGYTIGVFSTGFLTSLHMVPTPPTLADYELVSMFNQDPAVIATGAVREWKDLRQLVDYGIRNPKNLKVGINAGSSAHIFAAAFMDAAKIDAIYVPFRGGSERTAALAGGHIDVDFDIIAPMKPMIDAKKIVAFGVAATERSPDYKDIPTMAESGVPLSISSWHGVFVPRGTPPAVIAKLDSAVAAVTANPQFVEKMREMLLGIHHLDTAAFKAFFKEQDTLMLALIKKLDLYVEPQASK
jgi:tripartite-type tricarboxylate transporter receptor subunit TctC